jgi:hypothetical protein
MLREPAIKLALLLRGKHKRLAGSERTRKMHAVPELVRNIEPLRRTELHQLVEQDPFVHLFTLGFARR